MNSIKTFKLILKSSRILDYNIYKRGVKEQQTSEMNSGFNLSHQWLGAGQEIESLIPERMS